MPILSSLVSYVVRAATPGATSDKKVGIMNTLGFSDGMLIMDK